MLKCKECGTEFDNETVICPNCGAEVQIVPDFNIYEDEMFKTVKDDEKKQEKERLERRKAKREEENRLRRRKNFILLIIIAMVCIIIGIVAGIMFMNHKRNQNSYDYQLQMANEEYSAGDYTSALENLQNALSLNGNSLDARFLMSQIYLNLNEYDAAVDVLNEIFIIDPANQDALSQILSIYDSENDYDAIYQMAEENEEDSFNAIFANYLVTTPTVNVPGGSYTEPVELTFSYPEDLTLYYTLDGSAPSETNGTLYSGEEIKLDSNTKVRAVCYDDQGRYSIPLDETYKIDYKEDLTPIIEPESGVYTETTLVSIQVPEGATAYYTTDGSQPTALSTPFTEPFEMPEGNNVLSVLVIKGSQVSDVVTRIYTYTPFDKGE